MTAVVRVRPAARLAGVIRVPGDKSISHRALLFSALAAGRTTLVGLQGGADVRATATALRALGVPIVPLEGARRASTGQGAADWAGGAIGRFGTFLAGGSIAGAGPAAGTGAAGRSGRPGAAGVRVLGEGPGGWSAVVDGGGPEALREPIGVIDTENSGTTARLLLGLLSSRPFFTVLTGDASLVRRPMERVVEPLRTMGARIDGRDGGRRLPLAVRGGPLRPLRYRLPVASAQVKSALILAGLFADGESVIEEPTESRDHTERLLAAFAPGALRIEAGEGGGRTITVRPVDRLRPVDLAVPGDFSSAAFFFALAAAHPDADIVVAGVGVNPTRTGMLDVLRAMGAGVDVRPSGGPEAGWEADQPPGGRLSAVEAGGPAGEPVADVRVTAGPLVGTEVGGALVPRLIDELPVIAVLATQARGRTVIRDAAELRVKETDRIAHVVEGLRAMGARVEARDDGMVIEGPTPLRPARVHARGDHRLAMAFAVAGLLARPDGDGATEIVGAEAVQVSYPGFFADLARLGAAVEAVDAVLTADAGEEAGA
ncbi:3-phosphoshikimate 1-carboxyvinyltransferase [Hydrogenibacillus sp. N12]|uniref:3-phosphoshikimate 1-carboxyvinyltransferase n=1 Tax=Hydrogenibacillus sp. N12 TaxID=2866627 RepID=UPI001C7D3E2A|nr:3-phosphoshikimate 1-carboxyvinyltransferase [Hydrogenibacillus sp. N12]QZA33786.1 3-phosphoshikimate 1-carboxyvinyltransferase [Hydrogenibacillus sp. N12]